MLDKTENRARARESLFQFAEIILGDGTQWHKVRVRNLSANGMKAEGNVCVAPGDALQIRISNIGALRGKVAWADGTSFGVAFDTAIDPKQARKSPASEGPIMPRYLRPIKTKYNIRH